MGKLTSKDRVCHVLDSIRIIKDFVNGITEKEFMSDLKLQGLLKNEFVVIGEAIRHVDIEILDKYKYPWHIPRAFRNYIVHEYHGLKLERLYFAANDLEDLEKK